MLLRGAESSKLLKSLAARWSVLEAGICMMSLGRLSRVGKRFLCVPTGYKGQALLLRHHSVIC